MSMTMMLGGASAAMRWLAEHTESTERSKDKRSIVVGMVRETLN
jgi:hypothetical protein